MIKGAKVEEEKEEFPYKAKIRVDTSLISDDATLPYVLNNIKIGNQYYNIKSKFPFFMFVRAAGDYYLVVTSSTSLSAYVTKYEGGVGMERVGLGSDMMWFFTKDIVYESDLADAVSNHPVYKVQRTIAGQSNTPLAYWSSSIVVANPYLTIDDPNYQLPSNYDPTEFKYICVVYYSENVDYVLYSKNPFYAEQMSDGKNYAMRITNGNSTLQVKPGATYFRNPVTKYAINGIEYGGSNSNYLSLRTTQTNYPILPIDVNGNIIA